MDKRLAHTLMVVFAAGCSTLPEPNLKPPAPVISVVSYNVNWGCPAPRAVLRYIRNSGADVICLQETNHRWQSILESRLSTIYPHRQFANSRGAGGSAYLSRWPLENTRLLTNEAGWFPALATDVQTPDGVVQILNVHLQPPLANDGTPTPSAYLGSPKLHRQEIVAFMNHLNSDTPALIAGDFNENDNGAAVRYLVDQGYTSALHLYDRHSDTWVWKVMPGVVLNNRYDHILFSRHLSCPGAKVTAVRASDHMPVFAVFVDAGNK